MAISDRIVDLLPVVRNSISGVDRHSLKVIKAPIADPAFTYADLQIQNGSILNAVMTLLTLDGGDKESTTGWM